MPKANSTLTWRVGQLEKKTSAVDIKINNILQNHLPHIQEQLVACQSKLESLESRMKLAVTINVVQVIAVVLGIVLLLRKV